jgi:hypothetical protein
MVGLHVGVDDARDPGALEGREVQVPLEVVCVRVYDRRRLVAHSPEDVGGTPRLRMEELLEDHLALPSVNGKRRRQRGAGPRAHARLDAPTREPAVPCTLGRNRDKVKSDVLIKSIREC